MKRLCTIFTVMVALQANAQTILEYGASVTKGSGGTCINCEVLNENNALGNTPGTYASLKADLGVSGGYAQITLKFATMACAGDTMRLYVQNASKASDAKLEGVVFNYTSPGGDGANQIATTTNALLINGMIEITYVPNSDYDGVRIRLNSSPSTVSELRVFMVLKKTIMPVVLATKDSVCFGDSTVLTASSPIVTVYTWFRTPSGGLPFYTGNSMQTAAIKGDSIWYVGRCSGSRRMPVRVYVKTRPDEPVIAGPDSVCDGQSAKLMASNSFPGSRFHWFDSLGNFLAVANPYITGPLNYANAPYRAVSDLEGCLSFKSGYDTVLVDTVFAKPNVRCSIPSTTSVTIEWDPVPGVSNYFISGDYGATIITSTSGYSWTINPMQDGQDTTLVVQSNGPQPCGPSAWSTPVRCIATKCVPVSFTHSKDTSVCAGNQAKFSVGNINVPNYVVYWNGVASGQSTTFFTSPVTEPGFVYVTVENPDQPGCPTTMDSMYVDTLPRPDAEFTSDNKYIDIPDGRVRFFDETSGSVSWKWEFGDGNTSNERNPLHHYQDTGKYSIRLITTNTFGCVDTAYKGDFILARHLPVLDIPNAFSPNGDGKNDRLRATGKRIATFSLQIYNEWGTLIYEGNDLMEGWDGTYNGKAQQVGAYFYKARAEADNKMVLEKQGIVNLIR